ncbi:MAG TPA: hypothetical protein VK335_11330 [Bryobacteraceae bacterium]|nr:hypothetical protein [Bryobacteraceae bacterium]
MGLKAAALLAFAGTALLAFVLAARLVMEGWNLLNGAISMVAFLTTLVYAFAAVSLAMFFWVFQKTSA